MNPAAAAEECPAGRVSGNRAIDERRRTSEGEDAAAQAGHVAGNRIVGEHHGILVQEAAAFADDGGSRVAPDGSSRHR